MSENNYKGIIKRYDSEIKEIFYITESIKKGRYYGTPNGTNAPSDGLLATNMEKIEEKLKELLVKIEKDKPSTDEEISELFKND